MKAHSSALWILTNEGEMLIYDQLKRDHDRIRGILKKIDATSERAVKTRADLLVELKTLLAAHAKAEEAVFYRTMIVMHMTHDQALESIDDHKITEAALDELEDTDPGQPAWMERFRFLRRNLEHHFEEEEKDLFKKARKFVSNDDAREMGEQFVEMRTEYIEDLGT